MTAVLTQWRIENVERHLHYLCSKYQHLSDPKEREDVLDEIVFYRQMLRELREQLQEQAAAQ